jgi:hypothetical protein
MCCVVWYGVRQRYDDRDGGSGAGGGGGGGGKERDACEEEKRGRERERGRVFVCVGVVGRPVSGDFLAHDAAMDHVPMLLLLLLLRYVQTVLKVLPSQKSQDCVFPIPNDIV